MKGSAPREPEFHLSEQQFKPAITIKDIVLAGTLKYKT